MDIPGVASFGFAVPTESVTAVPYPPARPELIRVTYERSVLPLVLQAGGAEVLHASAVYMREGASPCVDTPGQGNRPPRWPSAGGDIRCGRITW